MHGSQESCDLSSESLLESPFSSVDDKSSYWQNHFESWENSGLGQAEYCRRHDLKYRLFHYWKRKLRKPFHQIKGNRVLFYTEPGQNEMHGRPERERCARTSERRTYAPGKAYVHQAKAYAHPAKVRAQQA